MSNTKLQDQILLPRDPAASLEAATKQYVDGAIAAATPTQGVLYASGTAVAISNTTTETDLIGTQGSGLVVPAGTLGANGALKVRVSGQYLNSSGASKTFTLRIYYGGTLMYAGTTGSLSTSTLAHAFDLEFALQGAGATNAQNIGGTVSLSAPGGTTGLGLMSTIPSSTTGAAPPAIYGAAAIDSTLDQALRVTIANSAAASTVTFTGKYASACLEGVGIKGDAGSLPTDYISGLLLSYVDASHIACSSGAACFPDVNALATVPSSFPVSIGTPAASTWYHAYLYYSGGSPILSLSTTAPTAPYLGTARGKTGAASYRYLGSVLTDASGNLQKFLQLGRTIRYLETTSGAPFRVLSNGAATTSTSVDLSGCVPTTAQHVSARIANLGTAQVYVGSSDIGAVSPTNYMLTERPGSDGYYELVTDSSQNINYILNGASNGIYIDVLGYEFLR